MPIFISQDIHEVVNEPLIGWHDLLHQNMAGVSDLDGMQQRRNALNGLTYNFWHVPSGSLQGLSLYMEWDVTVNYVGIAAHTLGSSGRRVRVRWSDDSTNWVNAHSEDWFAPSTDAPLMIHFPTGYHRYWTLNVEAAGRNQAAAVMLMDRAGYR